MTSSIPLTVIPKGSEIPVGAIGLVSQPGSGRLTRFFNWLIQFGTEAPVSHAFLKDYGDFVIEALPSRGVKLSPVSNYDHVLWVAPARGLASTPGGNIVHAAVGELGREYNWPGIAAITWSQRRLPRLLKPKGWIANAVEKDGEFFCSQLVAYAYRMAGIYLMPSRDDDMISPGDIWRLAGSPKEW
jgi:hypothetical protein